MNDTANGPARRIILAGGNGFLGNLLAKRFVARGDEVVILTRSPHLRNDGVRELSWDGNTLGDWAKCLDDADAVINLAGRSVNCRYHERNRREILDSRIHSTRVLGQAIARCKRPPRVWLNASTATIYKHSLERDMDETTGKIAATPEAKDAFSVEVARAWEATFNEANTPATRKVALRSAMVLGHGKNSVFPMLRQLTLLGLGGRMGNGKQFVSWIHQGDFLGAVEWLLEADHFHGLVNLAAPNPIPNHELMRFFRRFYRVPIGLPAPLWALEVGAFFLRTETELIIKSRRVVSGRLREAGFEFRFPRVEDAVKDLEDELRQPASLGSCHARDLAQTNCE